MDYAARGRLFGMPVKKIESIKQEKRSQTPALQAKILNISAAALAGLYAYIK